MGTDTTGSTVIYDTLLRSKKRKQIENEKELNKRYTRLFEIVNSNAELNEHIIMNFIMLNTNENIERERARGIILRSKVQWTEGEKILRVFSDVKKKLLQKTNHLFNVGKNVITDPMQFLEEGRTFYDRLYSDNDNHISNHIRED